MIVKKALDHFPFDEKSKLECLKSLNKYRQIKRKRSRFLEMTAFGDVLHGKFSNVSIRLKTVYFGESALINRAMVYRLIQCFRFERRNTGRAR